MTPLEGPLLYLASDEPDFTTGATYLHQGPYAKEAERLFSDDKSQKVRVATLNNEDAPKGAPEVLLSTIRIPAEITELFAIQRAYDKFDAMKIKDYLRRLIYVSHEPNSDMRLAMTNPSFFNLRVCLDFSVQNPTRIEVVDPDDADRAPRQITKAGNALYKPHTQVLKNFAKYGKEWDARQSRISLTNRDDYWPFEWLLSDFEARMSVNGYNRPIIMPRKAYLALYEIPPQDGKILFDSYEHGQGKNHHLIHGLDQEERYTMLRSHLKHVLVLETSVKMSEQQAAIKYYNENIHLFVPPETLPQ